MSWEGLNPPYVPRRFKIVCSKMKGPHCYAASYGAALDKIRQADQYCLFGGVHSYIEVPGKTRDARTRCRWNEYRR